MLDGHRDHVQHDRYHNTQLKLGANRHVVEYCLQFMLENMGGFVNLHKILGGILYIDFIIFLYNVFVFVIKICETTYL